jgi:hypothetical protein
MWEDEAAMTRSLVSVFRDLRHGGAEADREPDVRVTLPLIESVVAKFMAQLTTVPQINVLTPPIGYAGLRKEETARALADQNEKYLYGLWEQNRVRRHYAKQAWYLPLMGACFQGIQPDFDSKTVKYMTRSPEHAYPVWDTEMEHLEALMFKWEVPADQAVRTYGSEVLQYIQEGRGNGLRGLFSFGSRKPKNPVLEIVQWWDHDSKTTLVGGHKMQEVQHGLGFCPWTHTPFYLVPDEPFGKGVIEGNVALFQKLNMLDSLELQAIIENVFARMVIINPAVGPEDFDNGPGGVIAVGLGGDVKWVSPPATTTDLSQSMGRSMDFVQRGTHLPGSAYGEGVASSITTGKAQHESLMPTGNIIEYVQGNIADSWERLNEMSVDMTAKVFANRKVVFFGRQYTKEGLFSQPKQFQVTVDGADLKGWVRHELSFQPMLNMHEKIVMGLQLAGGGLVSKRWQRDQVGIVDNDAMQEEILSEMQLEAKLASIMGMLGQPGSGITPDMVENWFLAMEKGGTAPDITPAAPAAAPGMPPGAPGAPAGPLGLPMPPGGAAPPAAPPAPASGDQTLPIATNPGDNGPAGPFPGIPAPPGGGQSEGQFTLDGAVGDFSRLKKVKGRIFLVGEIVQKGSTDGPVEVDVTNPIDKSTIINGLPDEYHGQLTFHTVPGEPEEQHVEVGPGKTDGAQGGGPVVDHPDTVTRSDDKAVEFDDMPISPGGLRNPPLASNYPTGGFQGSLRS